MQCLGEIRSIADLVLVSIRPLLARVASLSNIIQLMMHQAMLWIVEPHGIGTVTIIL